MNVSYDYYRIFYYVAKYRSFRAAAGALLNNQPNLTRMIRRLEEELGCALFYRQRYGVSLTPEGEKLYSHVSAAFEHIFTAEAELESEKALQTGTVTVAASEIALHCVLLPALKHFRQSCPEIRIRIVNYFSPQAVAAMQSGTVDFAVVTEPFSLPAELVGMKLKKIREVPVISSLFSIPAGSVLKGEQLGTLPLVGIGENSSSFLFYSEYFGRLGLIYSPEVEAATADQILPLVRSGLGIGFVPTDFFQKESMEGLCVLTPEISIPERNVCLIKRKNVPDSFAAAALLRYIEAEEKPA